MHISTYKLKNYTGIRFHVVFNLIIQLFAFVILYKSGHYPFWILAISFCSILFGVRRVDVNTKNITINYPLIPFYSRNIEVSSIKKITFNLHEGTLVYPHLTLIYSKFPFYSQIRIGRHDNVEDILKILSKDGVFKVKILSDKHVMKKRLEKILNKTECSVV